MSIILKLKERKIYEQARALISQNEINAANKCLIEFSKKNKLSVPTLYLLCLSYALSGKFKQSLELGLKLNNKKPNTIEFLKIIGSSYHELKEYNKAIKFFKRALTINPSDITSLSNIASAYKENNQLEEAENYFQHSLSLNKQQPDALSNLGLVLQSKGNYEEAIKYHEESLQLSPSNVNALYNLAYTYKLKGNKESALHYYNNVLSLQPDHIRAACDLSQIYGESKQAEKAIELLKQAYNFSPNDEHVLLNMGVAYKILSDYENAEIFFLKTIEINPSNITAKYFLSILKGDNSFNSSPDEYVQELFDGYAETFDEKLISELQYKTPQLIGDLIKRHINHSKKYKILDLGCGTGLAGIYVKDIISSMVGVDLSEKMLQKAAERNIYTELVATGIEEYFEKNTMSPDIIISADVFVYIGDLTNIFSAASKSINKDGFFAFSTEDAPDISSFKLRKSGRFAHNENYIRDLADKQGFKIKENQKTTIRFEAGKPINGQVYLLTK